MKLKVISPSAKEAKDMLARRYKKAEEYRKKRWEKQWSTNESLLFNNGQPPISPTLSYNSLAEVFAAADDGSSNSMHIPQVMRNLRIIHSQLSANPPSAVAESLSNELRDRHSAKVANHLIDFGLNYYKVQEKMDLITLSTLVYGSGWGKMVFDGSKGDVLRYIPETDEVEMKGDISFRPILIWNMYIDPDAEHWEEVRYTFERIMLSYDEARSMFPDHIETLKQYAVDMYDHPSGIDGTVTRHLDQANEAELETALIPILEYYEKAAPTNGMAGRHCYCLPDGTLLSEMKKSPVRSGNLPYGIITDIDVPGEVYGKTTVDYAVSLSRVLDELDTTIKDNIDIHGNIHLVVFEGSEINESDITNDPVDIIRVSGAANVAPFHLAPPSLSPDVYNLRTSTAQAIDEIMGVNEALKGQVPRELSGYAVQTAMNAANMARRRLFNKYTLTTEGFWSLYLDAIQENWTLKHKVLVVGEEDAAYIEHYNGADLEGRWHLQVTYGDRFSLDPWQKRQEIMQLLPVLEKAGVPPQKIAKELRYQDIEAAFDPVETAQKRQWAIFDEMVESWHDSNFKYIPASDMRKANHAAMAEAAMEYVMQARFLEMPDELREKIYKHMDEREQLAAQAAAPAAGAAPAGPGMAPEGALPPGGAPAPAPAPGGAAGPQMPDIGEIL